MPSTPKSILLIISGGIAAYKSLELIRLLRTAKMTVRCVLTKGGAQFVTPLSLSALSKNPVYSDLWSLKDESEMGHIRLSREADLIVIAPASANMIAKMAHGLADDLASTTLLAADKSVMIAPAMNQIMWTHPATQDNLKTLKQRGVHILAPASGEMACGETGEGRMQEAADIFKQIQSFFLTDLPLQGQKALVTSGPTYEPIDPVRFLGNRSSGKQGHAIACALRDAGAEVTLITGPVALPDPENITVHHVETAADMHDAALTRHQQADIAICAAAPSDWRPKTAAAQKIKKHSDKAVPSFELEENEDILKMISHSKHRPKLVIGFAAETDDLLRNAAEKLKRKGCDWIIANDVSGDKAFGHDENQITLLTETEQIPFAQTSKQQIAEQLVKRIAKHLKTA